GPLLRKSVEITADSKLHRGSPESVGELSLESIAAVRLLVRRADVALGDSPVADPKKQPAHHSVVWMQLVVVLPILHSEDFVQPVHDRPDVYICERQRAIAFGDLRLELHFGIVERGRQGAGDVRRI